MKVFFIIPIGLLAVIFIHTLSRIVCHYYKFPLPPILAKWIDHPLRHRMQPPDVAAIRHGIEPGMRVLEVGPGSGTYTVAAARRVGPAGRIVAVDIEPKMIAYTRQKAEQEGVANLDSMVADVHRMPFPDDFFDAIYMITVIGEIPQPKRAIGEFHRVLKPSGSLAFSELFVDPDYPLPRTLIRWATEAGFRFGEKTGNFFYYTLVFIKMI